MAGNLAPIVPALFTGPNGERLTADQIKRRQEIAQSLMAQATDTSPNAGGWASILAKGVQGFAAGRQNRMADQANALNAKESSSRVAALLGGLTGSPAAIGQGPTVSTPSVASVQSIAGASTVPASNAVMPVFADDGTELGKALADEAIRASLPAGMRNNNPGNIKFVGQKVPGIIGPSVNTDQGDPQAVFDSPESGMRAMYGLLSKKYTGGKLTPNQMIAGNMGWTPGNFQAAANVAKTMGISPDDDIKLNDPNSAAKFMQALILQEHGNKGRLYPQSLIASAITGSSAPQQAIEAVAPSQSAYVDPMVNAQPRTAPVVPVQSSGLPSINPAVIASLSASNASPEEKQMAGLLLERQLGQQDQQQKLALAQQQRQQEIARRQQIAQQNGINPAFASDDELWKGAAGQLFAAPSTSTVGNVVLDNRTGQPIYTGAQQPTADMQNYEYYSRRETDAGRTPLGPLEYEQALRRSGANNQTISLGGNEFDKELGGLDAKALGEISNTGMAAQRNVGRIDQLDSLLKETPSGAEANFKLLAGNYGINLGPDTSNVQAAQAIINSLVPEQRQPGSGPMSDADLDLFKKSLPSLINQPGGNQQIINNMRSIAQYDAEGARIVQRLRLPDGDPQKLNRAQAFEMLQKRTNPLANFKVPEKQKPQENPLPPQTNTRRTSSGVQWSID